MTQKSHVPKFGNWDNDNIPYTAYFDNARKEKTSPTRSRMNPNDPEENPEAFFMFGRSEATPPHLLNLQKSPPEESHHVEAHRRSNSHRRTTTDHQQRSGGTSRSINSESGSSEKSNSDYSHHRKKSQPSDGSISVSSPVPTPHTRLKSIENPPSNDPQAHRVASVPKFGAWDETDPTSGEGFTVIFNKVKQERQVAATTLPTVPPPRGVHSDTHKKNQNSKICCCCCCFWA